MKHTQQQQQPDKQPEEKKQSEEVVVDTTSTAVDEWKNKYIRALADYQNLEKRTEEEKQEVRMYATRIFLEQLLPIVDNLERAEIHIQDEGLHIVMKELHALLSKHGVEKIDVVGKKFDPFLMECIEVVEGEKDMVMEFSSPGYTIHNKLLREAKVKVGKGETIKE